MTNAERDAIRDYIVRTIDSAVLKAVAAIDLSALRGKDGEKGEKGEPGKDAVIDMDTLTKSIDGAVSKAVSEIDLSALRGKDGRGIEAATVGEGMLVLRYTDGTEQIVGRVMGEPGAPGKDAVLDVEALAKEVVALVPLPKDGKDAEPVDRVTLAKDVLALIPVPRDGKDGIASMDALRAEVSKAVEETVAPAVQKEVAESFAALPTLQYRGVFREGKEYRAGDCVTWAGAMWHADEKTQQKPGEGATAWTLMVKRGDKGRDAPLLANAR
jgi:hypothetical protein